VAASTSSAATYATPSAAASSSGYSSPVYSSAITKTPPYPATSSAYSSYTAPNATVSANSTGGLIPPPQVTVNAGTALDSTITHVGLGGFGLGLVMMWL
jgi:hypothetical protein